MQAKNKDKDMRHTAWDDNPMNPLSSAPSIDKGTSKRLHQLSQVAAQGFLAKGVGSYLPGWVLLLMLLLTSLNCWERLHLVLQHHWRPVLTTLKSGQQSI